MGTGKFLDNPGSSAESAFGPPVETPMVRISGRMRTAGLAATVFGPRPPDRKVPRLALSARDGTAP
jgi:hypothetical protein